MRTHRIIAGAFLCVGIGGGCSLVANFSGLVGEADDGGGADVRVADGSVDAKKDAIALDAPANLTDGTPAPCNPSLTIAADAGFGQFTPFSTVDNYPHVESFFGDNAMVLLPFRDISIIDAGPDADPDAAPMQHQQEINGAHVGLFLPDPVAVAAFDVTFDAKIVCTTSGDCADGLIFAWLDISDTSSLTNTGVGDTAGLPFGVSGSAFDMDDYQNMSDEVSDPYAPSLQIVAMDKTKTLDTYPWQVNVTPSTFPGNWHTYKVSLRSGTVSITYDDTASITGALTPLTSAIVGFTAGVGGESDAVAIRNLSAQFYACQP